MKPWPGSVLRPRFAGYQSDCCLAVCRGLSTDEYRPPTGKVKRRNPSKWPPSLPDQTRESNKTPADIATPFVRLCSHCVANGTETSGIRRTVMESGVVVTIAVKPL